MSIERRDLDVIDKYLESDRPDEAYELLVPLFEQYTENVDLWHMMGVYHQKKSEYIDAEKCLIRALEINPVMENAIFNLAVVYYQSDKKNDSLLCLRKLIAINPQFHQALYNAGELASELQLYWDSVQFFDRYLFLFPHKTEEMTGKIVMCLQWAEQQQPDNIFIKLNLIEKLQSLPKEPARDQQIHELKIRSMHVNALEYNKRFPNDAIGLGVLVGQKLKLCSWAGLNDHIDYLRKLIMTTDQCCDPALNLIGSTAEEQYVNMVKYTNWRYPDRKPYDKRVKINKRGGKFTIGYLSSDFHEHATSYLIASLFEHHNRDLFRVIAFSGGHDDHSTTRERLKAGFDEFVDIRTLSPEDAKKIIESYQIDILVDLKGYTMGHLGNIVSLRPAPIIVNYLGYPATTGGLCDYIIADKHVLPETIEKYFTEKVIRLPCSYQVNDDKCVISEPKTRFEYGLPEKGKIYASFNQPYKITPDTWERWMNRLSIDHGAVLWQYFTESASWENLQNEAEKHGINAQRIIPAGHIARPDHLARFKVVDVFFDTTDSVAGHTTMSDAIRMKVPEISMLSSGKHNFNTFIQNVPKSLLANKATLFNAKNTTSEIEKAYIKMIEEHNAD